MDASEMLRTAHLAQAQVKSLKKEMERVAGDPIAEQMIREEIARLQSRYRAVHAAIESVPDGAERLLLRNRYLFGLTWRQITGEMRISKSAAHRLHALALDSYLRVSCGACG